MPISPSIKSSLTLVGYGFNPSNALFGSRSLALGRTPVHFLCLLVSRAHVVAHAARSHTGPAHATSASHSMHAGSSAPTRRCPSSCNRRLQQVSPIATCATPDLLLQHTSKTAKTLETYIRNTCKHLKTLESHCKHMQCQDKTLATYV